MKIPDAHERGADDVPEDTQFNKRLSPPFEGTDFALVSAEKLALLRGTCEPR